MEDTMQLSASALLVLRFGAKNWPIKHPRPDAYRELVAARIMVPDGEDFKLMKDRWTRRIEFSNTEGTMKTALSPSAHALLCRRLAGERVEVTDETRPFYRELVDAGMMMPLHTFALGPNSAYRLTDAACDLREALNGRSNHVPSG
jgi:hypothetical protein